jgi:transposase
MRALDRNEAFALYAKQGLSLRRLAEVLNISRSTLERWSIKDDWVNQRQRLWQESQESARQEYVRRYRENDLRVSDQLFAIFRDAHLQHVEYFQGKVPRRAVKYSVKDLARLAQAVIDAGASECRKYLASEIDESSFAR